ncbi:MAG TPA: PDZ domain-containing protein [Candidatus Acidoferrum sp.]|nr:PDZ domain-containing protein [Candidatus Acidoferrum sp.]
MSTQKLPFHSVRHILAALVVSLLLIPALAPSHAADDNGTLGLFLAQLYDPQRLPSHLGPLVVLHVVEGSPAEKAGIQTGNFIVAVNGVPVGGRDLADIRTKELRGPIGDSIRLTVDSFGGSPTEMTLVRAPYPTHINPASDPFSYTVPGSWSTDPRYLFPLPWWRTIPYHGFEDIFFSPNFDQTDSPEYHSFLFYLWFDGMHMLSAQQLQSDAVAYFRGIATERGQNYNFTPDLSNVSANYTEDSAASHTFGGAPARAFYGTLSIYDTHGKVIKLNSEVLISTCGTSDHTVIFFGQSLEPRDGEMWKRIDAIRDSFHCKR